MSRLPGIANRVALTLGIACVLLYAGDWAALRFHIPPGRPQFGTYEIHPLLAVPQKGRKVEYISADPETVTCSHSLFPQMGYSPCWYVAGHRQPRRDM